MPVPGSRYAVEVIESSGAKIKRNMPLSPNLRAHVERFIQTLKVDCPSMGNCSSPTSF